MDSNELDDLESLLQAATEGPWYVREFDDEVCMSATVISTAPPKENKGVLRRGDDKITMRQGNWPTGEVLAATLIQHLPYVGHASGRSDEDAALIAALRNAAPALIALARRGLEKTTGH